MQCPKCRQENPEKAQYCVRCHTPLSYTCPACKNVQAQGGKCDKCGVDFAKYSAMLIFSAKDAAAREHERTRAQTGIIKQILLLPITGGFSLLKYLREWFRGE